MTSAVNNSSIVNRQMGTYLRLCFATVLLMFYLAGNTHFTFIHGLIHPEEAAQTHSLADENDPCHRSIHHGEDKGCSHQFHVEKISGCSFFHIVVNTGDIVFAPPHSDFVLLTSKYVVGRDVDATGDLQFSFLTRGPPYSVSI